MHLATVDDMHNVVYEHEVEKDYIQSCSYNTNREGYNTYCYSYLPTAGDGFLAACGLAVD